MSDNESCDMRSDMYRVVVHIAENGEWFYEGDVDGQAIVRNVKDLCDAVAFVGKNCNPVMTTRDKYDMLTAFYERYKDYVAPIERELFSGESGGVTRG